MRSSIDMAIEVCSCPDLAIEVCSCIDLTNEGCACIKPGNHIGSWANFY